MRAADGATAVVNLAGLVAHQAELRPEGVALIAGDGARLTWSELDRRCTAAASALTGTGLVAGQRVALLAANSAAWVIAWFGALRAGLVVVPIDSLSSPDEVRNVLAHSGARVLITDRGADLEAGGSGGADAEITTVPVDTDWRRTEPVASPRDPEQLAVLLYTAGTSGSPRAAMLTHRALLAHCRQAAALGQLHSDDLIACLLPLSHVFGLNAVLGMACYVGAPVVVLDGLTDALPDVVARESVTVLPLPPLALHRLMARDDLDGLRGLRMVLCGAAPLPPQLAEQFTARTGVPVEQAYGLTEAAPGVAATVGDRPRGLGCVGRVVDGVEVRIGDGSEPGEPGHIWIRGANLFSGYWPDGVDGPDADGWFDTSDIGYVEAVDDGAPLLYLVDRSRELIIVNGFNVYPAEVEDVIAELPGVRSVAVVGRRDVGPTERVTAFVVGEVSVASVEEHCARRLARYKQPTMINIVDALPRGATGKVRKGELRSLPQEG